jgi:hypothetical protein
VALCAEKKFIKKVKIITIFIAIINLLITLRIGYFSYRYIALNQKSVIKPSFLLIFSNGKGEVIFLGETEEYYKTHNNCSFLIPN